MKQEKYWESYKIQVDDADTDDDNAIIHLLNKTQIT